jgi:hypothetical protein
MRSMASSFLLALFPALVGCGKILSDGQPVDGSIGADAHDAARSRDATNDERSVRDGEGDAIEDTSETTDAPDDVSLDTAGFADAPWGPDGEISLGPDCGRAGQACCPVDGCYDDGCCVANKCVASGDDCGLGAGICASGGCGGCGALGEPCCPQIGSPDCTSVDAASCPGCTQTGTYCTSSDLCAACGGIGQPCCTEIENGFITTESYYCNERFAICVSNEGGTVFTCQATCGGAGQPCCQYNDCLDGGCCMQNDMGFSGSVEQGQDEFGAECIFLDGGLICSPG